ECLALLTGAARVNALAIRTPPNYAALAAEASLSGGLLEALTEEEGQRAAMLEATFDRWVAGTGEAPFAARWSSVGGLPPAFLVVPRPATGDDEPTRRAFRAALFRTERPVLVVPPGRAAAFGKRVAIAWREH